MNYKIEEAWCYDVVKNEIIKQYGDYLSLRVTK